MKSKEVIDELTAFVYEKTEDEYKLFNSFADEFGYCFSFEEAQHLIDIIRNLQKTDKRILSQTIKIIKEKRG